jgi:parallel beta-helix repeat protein
VRNFYVSLSGNDSAAGTQDAPWKTIQRADSAAGGRVAGDCVNVAPGTYAAGLAPRHGGNLASPTGYVVYRCQQLDACKITALGGQGNPAFFVSSSGNGPNYLVLDGFELAASRYAAYGVGAGMYFPNGIDNHTPSSHHIWVINNIIHGFGQSGIDMGGGEYLYYIHNLSYANSHVTCDAQGSGIGIVIPRAATDYTPTTMDNQYAPFHNLVMWNVSRDNMLTECGNATSPYDTDGNGIIMDNFNNNSTGIAYPYQTLVANNIVYGNGGGGVKAFFSSFVTIANNTAYNNNLDPFNVGTGRGEIGTFAGNHNTFLNNIAYPLPATAASDPRCKGVSNQSPAPCPLMLNAAFVGGDWTGGDQTTNIWSKNISFGGTPPWGWGPQGNAMLNANAMNCGTGTNPNKCNVNPLQVNPAAGNFALQSGSPAIGYGSAESYLSSQSLDAGACDHRSSACP